MKILNRGLGFVRTIILARLLAPEDFGLLGIAMLAIYTLEAFSQTGFQTALVQKQENVESYLDTAWTISVIRGVVLFIVLFVSAPLISKFFDSPQVTLIIRIIGITMLLIGLRNIGIIFFQKELEFNKQFFYEFSGSLVDVSVSILLAFILRNVWALVWGGIAGHCVRLIFSYILHPYRPKVRYQKDAFQELFDYGKWVFASGILGLLITRGDDMFVGKMLGVAALGFYQMAYLFSNLPATEITHVISQVTFPAYSKLQNDINKLKEAYLKVLQATTFVSFPISGLIFVLAPEFTEIFLGQKWLPMVPAVQILVFAGLTRSIAATTGPVFYAVGKPRIDMGCQVIRFLVLAIFIYPFTIKWGISGASLAVLFSIFISNIGFCYMAIRITKCGIINFGKIIILPSLSIVIMILGIIAAKTYIRDVNVLSFLLFVGTGALVYIGMTYIFDRCLEYRMRILLKESLGLFRGSEF